MKKYGTVLATAWMAAGGLWFWSWANGLLMPEVAHTADDIATAHQMFGYAPWLNAGLAVVGVALTALAWRKQPGWVFRSISLVPVLVLLIAAVISRGTFVEMLMFSPVDEARFVSATDATFLQPEHLVLGVAVGAESKAYPVGMLAYHHIVNDRLAGEPYVATY
jgi:hypothetical protein